MEITTIGPDIAKRAFQAHGVDASGRAVLRRKLRRAEVLAFFEGLPPCPVGIEASSTRFACCPSGGSQATANKTARLAWAAGAERNPSRASTGPGRGSLRA